MRGRLRGSQLATIGLVALVAGVLPACGGDDEGTSSASATGGTSGGGPVAVTLQEFAVGAVPAAAPAGTVTFDVSNVGPDDVHEFVVISTDLTPTELPTGEDGAVLEDGAGMEVVDEIEDMAVDSTETLTVELESGPYVFICNIYDKQEKESHYQEGMRLGFTVE